jgi:hypothetical protein
MDLFRRLGVAFLLVLVLFPLEANAQGLTGALVGTLKDVSGGVIPGALVRVTSPALIGGERQTTSSDRGSGGFSSCRRASTRSLSTLRPASPFTGRPQSASGPGRRSS